MKRFILALKAFFKAWKNPAWAEQLLIGPALTEEKKGDHSHLALLSVLQQNGRFIDFIKEDIKPFTDAQVGAAVRKIHEDCANILEDLVTIRPLKEEAEGALIDVQKGYNSSEVKLVGKIKGEPPFKGVLVHKGWKVQKRSLPKNLALTPGDIIYPAEVEIKA